MFEKSETRGNFSLVSACSA